MLNLKHSDSETGGRRALGRGGRGLLRRTEFCFWKCHGSRDPLPKDGYAVEAVRSDSSSSLPPPPVPGQTRRGQSGSQTRRRDGAPGPRAPGPGQRGGDPWVGAGARGWAPLRGAVFRRELSPPRPRAAPAGEGRPQSLGGDQVGMRSGWARRRGRGAGGGRPGGAPPESKPARPAPPGTLVPATATRSPDRPPGGRQRVLRARAPHQPARPGLQLAAPARTFTS